MLPCRRWKSSGQGRLLSTPRVTTQNNIEAQITQGVQIPIQTVANNTVTVTFRDAALTLLVTPQITAANTVIMRITVENASPDFSRSSTTFRRSTRSARLTQVLVNDGETTVIGGIYVSREQSVQDRTPGLYRIPLLGWLFQRNEIDRRKPRAADLHHAANHQAVGDDRENRSTSTAASCRALPRLPAHRPRAANSFDRIGRPSPWSSTARGASGESTTFGERCSPTC